MAKPRFQFSNVVVVDDGWIGLVVKSWAPSQNGGEFQHDVYVRVLNTIRTYPESEIWHYVYSKELLDDQADFY